MSERPRILVIRGGAIGDFIVTLPAIRLLREAFPNAHLEILGYRHIVALAENRFYANGTRCIEYGPLSAFFAKGATLPEDLIDYFGSFQQVVSYLFDPDQIFEDNVRRAGVKHFLHGSPKVDDSAHATVQLARPLERIALYLEDEAPRIFPHAGDDATAAALLEKHDGPWWAIHPGSGSERKNWPAENWLALAREILDARPNIHLALVGGEADRAVLADFERLLPHARITFWVDQPLPVLAAAIARCERFAGHDSGVSHLAAAVETPCVLLFGPTDPDVWAPRNDRVQVIKAPDADLSRITVDEVLAAFLD